jgi:ribonuclease HI
MLNQGSKTLKGKQVVFDAEITTIEEALKWYQDSQLQHIVIHSDSMNAIARASHSGTRPGQRPTKAIRTMLRDSDPEREGRTAEIQWVKGYAEISGNEQADHRASNAAEKTVWSPFTSRHT